MRGRWGVCFGAVSVLVATIVGPGGAPAQAADPPTITTQVVTSFDGTPILTTLFVPASATPATPAPLVLQTHGWGGTGQQDPGGFVGDLLDAGYIVLTWDQRGFGCSGGEVTIDQPAKEGKDVSALIDWAVANAPVADDAGDPIVGMTGGSYAGGIQTAAASVDPRLDALAPEISWSDLRYTLYSGEVLNQGWATLLYGAGAATAALLGLSPDCPTAPQTGGLDPRITTAFAEGAATGAASQDALDFFAESSLNSYGQTDPVSVPTLVIQGSVDTLFDLTDGYGIVEHVRAQGQPARFIVFCGGHVGCPASYADAEDGDHIDAAILTWFARYLRGEDVETGSPVEYRTNEGAWRSADEFEPSTFVDATGSGSGSLVSVPIVEIPNPDALADQLASAGGGLPATPLTAAQLVPAGDPRAFTFEVGSADAEPVDVVGIPSVELTVSGTGTEVVLLAKLVDREANEVVNLQEGGVRVPLGGGPVTVDVPMPGVAYTLAPGHHLDLQVATASLLHANARTPAVVEVEATASVPVESDLAAPPEDRGTADEDTAAAPAGDAGAGSGALPATGGAMPTAAALLALAAGLVLLRARRHP